MTPPTITTAKGRCVSDPTPWDNAAGNKPSPAINAVIRMGRKRDTAPSIAASAGLLSVHDKSTICSTIITPFCTEIPATAINPTAAETEKCSPAIARPSTPPTSAKDTIPRINSARCTERNEEILSFLVPLQLAILALAGLATWFAVKFSLRIFDKIADDLSKHDPNLPLVLAYIDNAPLEIKPLLKSINQLIGTLAHVQQAESRFIANATHQLRTPLATLQVQTERALREVDPIAHREALARVTVALKRLGHLAHQLLTLARSERAAALALQMLAVNLTQLAREELERWVDAADARGIDLGLDAPDTAVMINAEAHLLRELIGNLVDNAIRYGAEGGTVTVVIKCEPIALYVDNEGDTIPESERALVLERFYRRADSNREGCGLGLAIAQEIARRHRASLSITESPVPPGTRVAIVFGQG